MSKNFRRSFLVLYNPTAGRRKQSRINDIVGRLRGNGAHVDIVPTSGPGHATDLGREAAKRRDIECVVAAGGDGTISETATGLLQALDEGASYEDLPPLGILPMGTANVMAQDLGLVTLGGIARRKTTKMLLSGRSRPLFLGIVENDDERRAFVMMVGAGFDGQVVAGIDLGLKKRFGKIAYVQSGLETLWRGCAQSVQLMPNGSVQPQPSQWVIVSNGQHYAGGYRLTRRTSLFRRSLLGVALKGKGRGTLIKGNLALGLGAFDGQKNAQSVLAQLFEIACNRDESVAEVDGDYFGRLPVRIGLAPKPIVFLQPLQS